MEHLNTRWQFLLCLGIILFFNILQMSEPSAFTPSFLFLFCRKSLKSAVQWPQSVCQPVVTSLFLHQGLDNQTTAQNHRLFLRSLQDLLL